MSSRKKNRNDLLRTPHLCPVCGRTEFPGYVSFEICEECGWQDDVFDVNDPKEISGANAMEYAEYKAAYESGWRPDWLAED